MRTRALRIGSLVSLISVSSCSLLVSTNGLEGSSSNIQAEGGSPESGPPLPGDADLDGGREAAAPDADAAVNPFADPRFVGVWSFDEVPVNGVIRDLTGHGHDGKINGSLSYTSNGHLGGAIEAHRSYEESIAMGSLDGTSFPTTGTLSFWFRYTDVIMSDSIGLFDFFAGERRHLFVRHANGETDLTKFQVAMQGADPSNYDWVTTFQLAPMAWHHIVVTWDGATREITTFANNTIIKRGLASDALVFSGQRVRFGTALNGAMDEIRLYNVVLPDAEIFALP